MSGTALVAPQRTHRFSWPLLSITLSRFQALRFLMFEPSCPLQLSSIHLATSLGGADQSHSVGPLASGVLLSLDVLASAPAAPASRPVAVAASLPPG
jgi:hypothetical protein